jgi:hypothetical protein
MSGDARLAYFYHAFGMALLRRCYHQILRPRRYLSEFADGLCRHCNARFHLNPHTTWQATKRYMQRANAFGLVLHELPPIRASRLKMLPVAQRVAASCTTLGWQFHLAFSASEVFVGLAVSDWPLPYAALIYRSPSFVIFVVQPVFQVITAELPSSFQVPVIPSPRVAFAAPSLDSVISNGCPAVSFTFHTPSKALAVSAAKLVTTKKQAAVRAAVAAFLIFVPPYKFKARGENSAKKNLPRLLHTDGSRPRQLFDATRA